MRTMQQWFDAYGESHQDPRNEAFHWICVPMIFMCVIGLFSLIPHGFMTEHLSDGLKPYVHFGTVVIVLGLLFYLRLSFGMTVGMLLVSCISLYLVKLVHVYMAEDAWWIFLGAFALAWVGQFIGHKIEGKKPSFFEDLQFLMIGPAWLLGFIYRKLGIRY
jgi:uncharacterized membrane protein YGL010W